MLLLVGLGFIGGVVQLSGALVGAVLRAALLAAAGAGEGESGDGQSKGLRNFFPVAQLGVHAQTGEVQMNRLENQENEAGQETEAGSDQRAHSGGQQGVVAELDDVSCVFQDNLRLDVVQPVAAATVLESLPKGPVFGRELGSSLDVVGQNVPGDQRKVSEEEGLEGELDD